MSVASKIEQLETDITNAYASINTMGGTIPEHKNTNNLSSAIESIPSGGSTSDYFADTITYQANTNQPHSLNSLIKALPAGTIMPTNCGGLFASCINLETVGAIDTSSVTATTSMFVDCKKLVNVPTLDFSSTTSINYLFSGCTSLVTAPSLTHTSSIKGWNQVFKKCSSLQNVPVYDMSAATGLNVFAGDEVRSLTTQSLNNILASLASATNYTSTKTLYYVFGNKNMSAYYPASTIEGLSNYQAFVNAGWSIGWS